MKMLYLKLKNLSKQDFLLIEYLVSNKKVCWLLTEKELLNKIQGGRK